MRPTRFAALALLALLGAGPSSTPFVNTTVRDFDRWDTNHDGVLSPAEVDAAVEDPACRGDDAAAAAAIKLLLRNPKVAVPTLTRYYLSEYDRQATAAGRNRPPTTRQSADDLTATVDATSSSTTRPARLPVDFDLYFSASRLRIARGGPEPWTGAFVLDHTRQGPLGDCFFLAPVGSMVATGPDRLAKLITPLDNGHFVVRFPGDDDVDVPPLTDGQRAISSTTAGDGVWLAVLEQAYGKHRAKFIGKPAPDDGTEAIRSGGDSGPAICALTGHQYLRITPGATVEARTERAERLLPEIRRQLVAAMAEHRISTAGMNPVSKLATVPPVPPDITTHHVYAVVGYDAATDLLDVWNPHGQSFTPRGLPGITNGWPTAHGRFKLKLTDAYQFFTAFTFETDRVQTSMDKNKSR